MRHTQSGRCPFLLHVSGPFTGENLPNLRQSDRVGAGEILSFLRRRSVKLPWWNRLEPLLVTAAGYAILMCFGITCPILWLTGISCAGCGMTRALLAAGRLDFGAAFAFHPLWPSVPLGVGVFLGRKYIPVCWHRRLAAVTVGLFLVVYVVRMADPADPIVRFSPCEGLLMRLPMVLKSIWEELGL